MKPYPCEWCTGDGGRNGHACPKCEGTGEINYHCCFGNPDPCQVHPAIVARMEHDPTYREIVDGPVLSLLPKLKRWVREDLEQARREVTRPIREPSR